MTGALALSVYNTVGIKDHSSQVDQTEQKVDHILVSLKSMHEVVEQLIFFVG